MAYLLLVDHERKNIFHNGVPPDVLLMFIGQEAPTAINYTRIDTEDPNGYKKIPVILSFQDVIPLAVTETEPTLLKPVQVLHLHDFDKNEAMTYHPLDGVVYQNAEFLQFKTADQVRHNIKKCFTAIVYA